MREILDGRRTCQFVILPPERSAVRKMRANIRHDRLRFCIVVPLCSEKVRGGRNRTVAPWFWERSRPSWWGDSADVSGGRSGGLLVVNTWRPTSLAHTRSLVVQHSARVAGRRPRWRRRGQRYLWRLTTWRSGMACMRVLIRMRKAISGAGEGSVGSPSPLCCVFSPVLVAVVGKEFALVVTLDVGDGAIDELQDIPDTRVRTARSEVDCRSRRQFCPPCRGPPSPLLQVRQPYAPPPPF